MGINYERVPQAQWVQKIELFIAEQDINYPCVIGDEATRKMIPDFRVYPTTLFINRAGVVRLKIVGYHPLEMLEAIVFELLGEPSGQRRRCDRPPACCRSGVGSGLLAGGSPSGDAVPLNGFFVDLDA